MYKVSFYKNIFDTESKEQITIDQFLKAIKNGKYKKAIEAIRQATTKKERGLLKKQLPNITASGTFTRRLDKNLIAHSGLKQIDIDHDENIELDLNEAKKKLSTDPFTFAAFISPSGNGLKLLVRINPDEDKIVYTSLEAYYKDNFNLQIDKACSNVSRGMGVSYDPDLYHNPDSKIFVATPSNNPKFEPIASTRVNDKAKEVELLIEKIEANKTDITGNYDQWLKIGFALASEFGLPGESYYHRISSFSTTYEPTACSKQYKICCKANKTGIAIATLFAIAKNAGVLVYESGGQAIKKLIAAADHAPVAKAAPSINENKAAKKEAEIIFYSPIFKSDDNGEKVFKDVKINYVKFNDLLYSFGFRRFDIDKDFIYIQLKDKVIKEVTVLQIQDYFFYYLENLPTQLTPEISKKSLKEKMYNNPKNYFCDNRLSLLTNKKEIIFNSDTKSECFIYYQNGFVRCDQDKWELQPYSKLTGYIWQNQIIKRDFSFMELSQIPINKLSVYAQFLYNVSGKTESRYLSLCSLVGYLLHSYTDVKMKAVILTDSRVSEEANGRTGKTLFGQTLKHIKKLTQINGKDFDPANRYKYQEANLDTQIVFLNDVRSNFRFETLYNDITEGITVEKKNQTPFSLKTKMCITTNKTISIEGSSSKDRCIEFEFVNHYSEKYSPEDEFKQRFFSDWDKTAWQQFDNFMMFCICVFLGNGAIEPESINLKKRKLLDQTHKDFLEFMEEKIKDGEIVANKEIHKQELHEKFLNEYPDLKDDKYKKRLETFTSWIKIFAKYAGLFSEVVIERKSSEKRFFTFGSK